MHSQYRARGKILFEVLCALGLAVSFASAWDDIRSPSLLASASIMALFATYWSFGLFGRRQTDDAAQAIAATGDARDVDLETIVPPVELIGEPIASPEPEPVAAAPAKRRPRKTKQAPVVASIVDEPEPPAVVEPFYDGPPLEPLFDPQPFARSARPAFGRKARGPRALPAT